ncbi:uncharacterized protein LOC118219414, partial [Anguilla anguilla]|uniref:uncharacterized protein LOC118219414 n=1 Tax=Anguilla anguilla TaxID=7936 RepID=UPI0015B1C7E6
MPRRGKRSEAAKQRWAKLDLSDPRFQSPELQSSVAVMEVCDRECTQEVCCLPVVSSPCTAQYYAQPEVKEVNSNVQVIDLSENYSVQESCAPPPSVISVLASHSQDHSGYEPESRNRQCTCMALTFLAHQNEGHDLKEADLDKILDKGDSLYKRTIKQLKSEKRFRNYYLTLEETPLTVATEHHEYRVQRSPVEMGFMRDKGDPGTEDWFQNLRTRLQCLSVGVTHALLTVSPYIIAVFRDQSGRYGLFDSHNRNADGLPEHGGKAVMMTFTHLDDLIEKIDHLNALLHGGSIDKKQFDFMPVTFAHAKALSHRLPSLQVQSDNPHDRRPAEVKVTPTTKHETDTGLPTSQHSLQSVNALSTHVISKATQVTTSKKLSKRQRKKQMKKQRKDTQLCVMISATGKKQTSQRERYRREADFREKKKESIIIKYKTDPHFRLKQKESITGRYLTDPHFRMKQKESITRRYKMDPHFRMK